MRREGETSRRRRAATRNKFSSREFEFADENRGARGGPLDAIRRRMFLLTKFSQQKKSGCVRACRFFRSVKRKRKETATTHPPTARSDTARLSIAPRTARARCRSSDHDKTPLKIRKKKKKASAYKKQKTSRGAFVSFDRVATRVAPSWPLFPLFTFF